MPSLSGQAATFRAGRYQFEGYASVLPYTIVLQGTLSATPTFPTLTVAYTLTAGAAADVKTDHLVVFFGSDGKRKGSARVAQATVTSTSLPIEETAAGTINLVSGDTFKVYDAYEIRDKLVSAAAALNKDSRISVSDNTSNPPPVANCGGLWAGFLDSGQTYATVTFDASTSFVVDPDSGGSLTYLWAVGDGTITVGSTTTAAITVRFPVGFRHITLTVTDADNSKSSTRYVPVWVHDFTGVNAPLSVQAQQLSYPAEHGASGTFSLPAGSQAALDNLPDGALFVYWEREFYGAAQASYGSNVTNRSHIKAVLYLVRDTIQIDPDNSTVTFEAVSPLQILERTPALPQLLIRSSAPDAWREVKGLTVNRIIHYLAYWHASAMRYFDFVWLAGTDLSYGRIAVDNIDTIAGQMRDVAASINTLLTCDWLGRFLLVRGGDYLSSSDRSGRTTVYNLTTGDVKSIDIPEEHRGGAKFVRAEGITAGAATASQKGVFSNAPGNAPAWLGTGQETFSKQIVASQSDLNTRGGMHFARVNGLYNGRFVPQAVRLSLPSGYHVFDPAYQEWLTLTLASTTNKRQTAFTTDTRWLIDSVDISYDGERGLKDISLTIHHETIGPAGVTYTPPKDTNVGSYTLPSIQFPPFSFTLPVGQLNAGTGNIAVFATDGIAVTTNWSAAEPNWTWHSSASLSISGQIEDFTVDAFSPLYLGTGSTVNGWLVTSTDIYRITDIFGSIAAASQFTFATALPDTQAKNSGRAIQTERGQQNWVVVASWYSPSDSLAKTGAYVTETTDGSAWDTEAALTTTGDDGGSGNRLYYVPGVYVSGKAANTAYSAAVDNGSAPSTFIGYKTTNGGSSWATFSDPAVNGNGLPTVIHVPWGQAADTIMYYSSGYWNGTITTDRTYRATGTTRTDISPTSGGRKMRPMFNHGIHTCDANRQLTAIAAIYGGVSGDAGVGATFVSRNAGDVWTLVRTPDSFGSRDAVVSIGGDGNSLYLLSVDGKVHFSSDFGANVQDKTGDLGIYTTARLVNLAGG